ncbi:hypothetical protein [Streptomyces wuyuanensis]|uniref:hypothetical protein n=1 Tax=Streptomyces wuyuanensis TaxID=1196353 RepID=UPI0036936D4C
MPVYFVMAGLTVGLSRLALADLGTLAAILVVAMTGQLLGAYLGARPDGFGRRPAAALGALLKTRGPTDPAQMWATRSYGRSMCACLPDDLAGVVLLSELPRVK